MRRCARNVREIVAAERDAAGARVHEAAMVLTSEDCRRRSADQADDLALVDAQVDAVDGEERP